MLGGEVRLSNVLVSFLIMFVSFFFIKLSYGIYIYNFWTFDNFAPECGKGSELIICFCLSSHHVFLSWHEPSISVRKGCGENL